MATVSQQNRAEERVCWVSQHYSQKRAHMRVRITASRISCVLIEVFISSANRPTMPTRLLSVFSEAMIVAGLPEFFVHCSSLLHEVRANSVSCGACKSSMQDLHICRPQRRGSGVKGLFSLRCGVSSLFLGDVCVATVGWTPSAHLFKMQCFRTEKESFECCRLHFAMGSGSDAMSVVLLRFVCIVFFWQHSWLRGLLGVAGFRCEMFFPAVPQTLMIHHWDAFVC